jgi:hypothetical protein
MTMVPMRTLLVATALTTALATGACRKEEQGRPLSFEPGVYRGEKSDTLPKQTVRQLQDRGALQK